MSESMVERVARGIAKQQRRGAEDWDEIDEKDVYDTNYLLREDYRAMARAAIEAMREPTEAMFHAAFAGIVRDHGDITGIYFDLKVVYRDMIDAALK